MAMDDWSCVAPWDVKPLAEHKFAVLHKSDVVRKVVFDLETLVVQNPPFRALVLFVVAYVVMFNSGKKSLVHVGRKASGHVFPHVQDLLRCDTHKVNDLLVFVERKFVEEFLQHSIPLNKKSAYIHV